jgi:hypothetical protein
MKYRSQFISISISIFYLTHIPKLTSIHPQDANTAAYDEDQTAAVAIECLQVLVVRPPSQLISDDQVNQLLTVLGDFLSHDNTHAALEAISAIGLRRKAHAQIICDTILPLSMARLSDETLSTKQRTEAFGVLKGLCRIGAVMDIAIPQVCLLLTLN